MFRSKLTRFLKLVLFSGILLSNIEIASAQLNGSGQAQLAEGRAIIVRQGKELGIDSYPIYFKDQDLIKTFDKGKVNLTLKGGDLIFLAPKTEIRFEEKLETKGLVKISNRILRLKGRLLAKIQGKTPTSIQIRTPNALVGVKGTEFVVEFLSKATNVGTIKGVVNLSSLATGDNIDLNAGTMSSVSASGEVLSPKEFSGEIMREFEFAGVSMSEKDSAGMSSSSNVTQSKSKEGCYLFVSTDNAEERSVVDQIVRPLIGSFVSPLMEDPVSGLSQSELSSSCYYEVSTNKVGKTLNLSITGQRTPTSFNGLSNSSKTFPENVRHSTLRVLHNELNKPKKDEICSKYSEILADECPQNKNLMVVFNKYSDSNLASLMKEPRSNLVSGVVSLVETMESVDFIGISDINYENDFQNNLKRMMDKKGSNFSLVFTTEWDFEKQETSMWKGFVSMNVSIESYSLKDGGLSKVGSYSIAPQRIPIRKWGESSSFKKKHLQRITKKVSQKWSDSEMKNFIQSNN